MPIPTRRTVWRASLMAPMALLLTVSTAQAAVYVVNSTGDAADLSPGDGVCWTGGLLFFPGATVGECTLRAMIQEANSDAALDEAQFDARMTVDAGGTIVFSPSSSLPQISWPLRINGTTAPTYDGSNPDEIPVVVLSGGPSSGDGFILGGNADGSVIEALSIVGFPGDAISIRSGADDVRVHACHLGIWRGSLVYGNGHGVEISWNAQRTVIGQRFNLLSGFTDRGNVISGNSLSGIVDSGTDTLITGNKIGTDRFGASVLPPFSGHQGNDGWGIELLPLATRTRVGLVGETVSGFQVASGNVIAGNELGGIAVNSGADSISIQANKVGTNLAGTVALGNEDAAGVVVMASGTLVGDVGLGANVVSGHVASGIVVGQSGVFFPMDVRVVGNHVGVNAAGDGPLGNSTGILVMEADGIEIEDNRVGGNTLDGISLQAQGGFLLRNYVGTNPAGDDLGNGEDGVGILGSANVLGDVATVGAGNVVGFNADDGVDIEESAVGTVLTGNFIGTDASGAALGNGTGVEVAGDFSEIGSPSFGTANVIAMNLDDGVRLEDASSATLIQRNYIGTNAAGDDLGNGGEGIDGNGAQAVIGSESFDGPAQLPVNANTIAYNGARGVQVDGASARIAIRGNAIFQNDLIAIDLGTAGPTPNDFRDLDEGPNRLQNHPEFDAAATGLVEASGDVFVRYWIESDPAAAAYPLNVDFYTADFGGEPETYIGTDEYFASEAIAFADFTFTPLVPLTGGESLVAVATAGNDGSSETSAPLLLPEPNGAAALFASGLLLRVLARRRR